MILSVLNKNWWYNYYTSLILIQYLQYKSNSLFEKQYCKTLMWLSYNQLNSEVYNWYDITGISYDKIAFNHYLRSFRKMLSNCEESKVHQVPREYIGLVNSL